ncbi:hypothetical protein, partial [Amycolatopsis circi]|uniref:hypothetical protein n=1 Tax=Amycolatopsis circi TaxID=871959 RepID=UPI001ABF4B5C
MTTTRWMPRGRIGLRPRRKPGPDAAGTDPRGDDAIDAVPEFRTLDETPDRRSPGFEQVSDHRYAADDDLTALADEVDNRRALRDSDAGRSAEKGSRRSTAHPSAVRRGTTDSDAGPLPPEPADESARRHLAANANANRRTTATAPEISLRPNPETSLPSNPAPEAPLPPNPKT